ncbi:hypothetical protein DMA11_11975 [Marinilabiliaceae bacterium JC017]|nr:hypothetical protein DMA11_11975 [Marinilabiliaceae bacterium JC017]
MVVCLCVFNLESYAQGCKNLESVFEAYQQGNSVYNDISLLIDNTDQGELLSEVEYYLSNEDNQIRYLSYLLVYKLVMKSPMDAVKYRGVFVLIDKGLSDEDAGLLYRVLNYLEEVPIGWFNTQSRGRLASIIMGYPAHFGKMIRLAGTLQMHELITFLESARDSEEQYTNRDKWNVQLVLGRMGDGASVDYCLDQVKQVGMNDQVVFHLVPDLLYLQNRQVIDFILDEILKEEEHCTSANPDNEIAINCGYRLLELVAPCMADFPVALVASGDLDVEDYSGALARVRAWIKENRETYITTFD